MRVRTRLLLAFAYILLVVIVALEIPFAITLNRRALREEENRVLTQAQAIADALELSGDLDRSDDEELRADMQAFVDEQEPDLQGARLLITDDRGVVLADSGVPSQVGESYAGRPEISALLRENDPAPFEIDQRFSDDLGQDILTAAAAVHGRERVDGIVRVSVSLEGVNREVRRIVAGTAAIGIAGLIAGLVIAWILARTLSRPLTRLTGAATRLGEGELGARSGVTSTGEIGEVARTFDAMADRLERSVTAQREFVANASHQLRTPLTGLKLRLEAAADDAPTEDLRRQIKAAEQEADRLAGIVEGLLMMSRRIEAGGAPASSDLGRVARTAAGRWEERARRAGGSVEVRGDGAMAAASDADVNQIVDNLIDNALAYAPGAVRIDVTRRDGRATLAVEDEGPGIPEEERGRVLERFYRGHGVAPGGSGLGLAIVRDLADRWGGSVEVGARDGGGTRVEVGFPEVS